MGAGSLVRNEDELTQFEMSLCCLIRTQLEFGPLNRANGGPHPLHKLPVKARSVPGSNSQAEQLVWSKFGKDIVGERVMRAHEIESLLLTTLPINRQRRNQQRAEDEKREAQRGATLANYPLAKQTISECQD